MSFLTIFGFFTLSGGSRITTYKSGSTVQRHHNHYMSVIQCSEDSYFDVTIRMYSPSRTDTLPDQTIALIIGQVAFTKEQAYIEATKMMPIPGDPTHPTYEDTIPNLPNPYVCGVGHVQTPDASPPTEIMSCINVSARDFVHDEYKSSSVR